MILLRHLFTVLVTLYVELVHSQNGDGPIAWTAYPFSPPALPLAVRNPYLSTWLPQGNNPAALGASWSRFWTGSVGDEFCLAEFASFLPVGWKIWLVHAMGAIYLLVDSTPDMQTYAAYYTICSKRRSCDAAANVLSLLFISFVFVSEKKRH